MAAAAPRHPRGDDDSDVEQQARELAFAREHLGGVFRAAARDPALAAVLPQRVAADGALRAAVALLKLQLQLRVPSSPGARIARSTLPADAGLGALGCGHGVQGETRSGGAIELILHCLALVGRGEVPGVHVWDLGAASGHCAAVMAAAGGAAVSLVAVELQEALHAAGVGGLDQRLQRGFFEGTGAAVPLLLRGCVLELVGDLLALRLERVPPTAAVTAYTDGMPPAVLEAIALCARALGAYLVVVTCRAVAVVLAALRRSGARWHPVATIACTAVGHPPTRFTQVLLANLDQLALAPAARARQRAAALAAARAAVRQEAADLRANGLLPPAPAASGSSSSLTAALAVTALGAGERVTPGHNELVMDANRALRMAWMSGATATRSQGGGGGGGAAAGGGGGGGGGGSALARRRAVWEAAARQEAARVAALTGAEVAQEARAAAAASLHRSAQRLARDEAALARQQAALGHRRAALVAAQAAQAAAAALVVDDAPMQEEE